MEAHNRHDELFDISKYLAVEKGKQLGQVVQQGGEDHAQFHLLCTRVKDHFSKIYEQQGLSREEKEKRLNIEHKALLGNFQAIQYLIEEINQFIAQASIQHGITYPEHYASLAEAVFHELYGFSHFSRWYTIPESTDGIIQGREIWFNVEGTFVKQQEMLRDDEHIWEIIRTLQLKVRGLRINYNHPEAELERDDGTRIKIIVPPRALYPTIIFRKFVIKRFSFEEQADRGTIAREDIPLFRLLAKLQLNTIIAGKVQSGKSTMLKTFFAERDPQKVAVLIEATPESFLKRDFPERLVHDFYTRDGNIHLIIRDALRTPHDYIIAQEVRGIEAEGAISGTERGTSGLLMTYHVTRPWQIAHQLARHIIDYFPNRREQHEVRRIAEQIDIGITMETVEGNCKRLTELYELSYDEQTEKVSVHFLMKYDHRNKYWRYASNLGQKLQEKMAGGQADSLELLLQLLRQRAVNKPLEV